MIIYFSGTGNSRFVAERISKTVNEELFDTDPYIKEETRKGVALEYSTRAMPA